MIMKENIDFYVVERRLDGSPKKLSKKFPNGSKIPNPDFIIKGRIMEEQDRKVLGLPREGD